MARKATARDARRWRGIVLGGLGLGFTFAPAIALLFISPSLAPVALGLMIMGLVLLVAGFLTVPRRL